MQDAPNPNFRRRRLIALVAALVLIGGAAGAWLILRKPGDVSNPKATFVSAPRPHRQPSLLPAAAWSIYGYDSARTKWFRGGNKLVPPFRMRWHYSGTPLLEFPPVVNRTGLYVLDDAGALRKFDQHTGHKAWMRGLGALAAASPALSEDGRVYAVTLLEAPGSGHGGAWSLDARSGRTLWHRSLPSRAESSPLIVGALLIFGSEDGTVYALDRRNGRTVWTYSASGAVKGGLALSGRTLFFGDYGGTMQAIDLGSGHRLWSDSPGGTFYSTAAVQWGRVYIGNTDGRLYSYTATGQLAWARQTGSYVYASPAAANVPGLGPTVFAGSYDGSFTAWDGRTGETRWSFDAGGKISGGAFVIGPLVWFSDLGNKRVVALNTRNGALSWQLPTGAFNPVITDGRMLYVTGYADLYGFTPRPAKSK